MATPELKELGFARLSKADEATRQVWGVMAAEAEDASQEIMDYTKSKPHFEEWSTSIAKATDGKSLGNVRVMHKAEVGGKLVEINYNDADKVIEVCAKVANDDVWNQIQEGYLTGFSIGGKYLSKTTQPDGKTVYVAKPSEVSFVDNPCLKSAHFTMVKADGTESEVNFHNAEEPAAEDQTANDGENSIEENLDATEGDAADDAAKTEAEADKSLDKSDTSPDGLGVRQVWESHGKTFAKKDDAVFHAKSMQNPLIKAAIGKDAAAETKTLKDLDRSELVKAMQFNEIVKKAASEDLAKGMYQVRNVANLIDDLGWAVISTADESAYEGDNSPVPGALFAGLEKTVAAFVMMVNEETRELLANCSRAIGIIPTLEGYEAPALEEAEKMAKSILAEIGDKAANGGDLAKADTVPISKSDSDADTLKKLADVQVERDLFKKQIEDALPVITEMRDKMEKLEKQVEAYGNSPAPMPTIKTSTIAKGDSPDQLSPDALAKALESMTEVDKATLMIKLQQSKPVHIGG